MVSKMVVETIQARIQFINMPIIIINNSGQQKSILWAENLLELWWVLYESKWVFYVKEGYNQYKKMVYEARNRYRI